jgi:p-aminobenzoyl-glutamate transporter AbgT
MNPTTLIFMALIAVAIIIYGIVWSVVKNKQGHEKEVGIAMNKFGGFIFIALIVVVVSFGVYYS